MKAKDLKNSILQLAVQGKLVEQNPSDEPASVLLERIREERQKLIAEKKLKAPKGGESVIYRASDGSYYEKRVDSKGRESEPVCVDEEIPFDIPESWEWVRMGSVLTFLNGRAYKKPELLESGKYPVLRVGNLFTNSNWYYSDMELPKEKYCHNGDLLYAWSASFGPTIWNGDTCIFHYHIWNVLHSSEISRDYLYWSLLEDVNRVKSATTGSTMIHVSMEHMIPRFLAIPPLAEQRRIVSRIEQLMPLVEEYGKLEDERELLDSELPERLRKSVLQMAVQGKLVAQDPTDEPASVLLERIREERQKLIAEKKLKAPKGGESVIYRASDGGYYEKRIDARGRESEPVCIDDEIPFDIPVNWEWARLSSIGEIVGGGTPKTTDQKCWANNGEGIPWLTPADMKFVEGKYVSVGTRNITELGLKSSSAQLMPARSVLMSSRAPIGYLAIASKPISTNQGFKSVVPQVTESSEWILTALEARMENIKERSSGTTFKEISGSEFALTLIPLPPLAEQHRIVERIDELAKQF